MVYERFPHRLYPPNPILLMKHRMAGSLLIPRAGKVGDRIETYGRGRVCGAPGCGAHLSAYNPTPYCSLHAATHAAGSLVLPVVSR